MQEKTQPRTADYVVEIWILLCIIVRANADMAQLVEQRIRNA